jgi:hypothetical protein
VLDAAWGSTARPKAVPTLSQIHATVENGAALSDPGVLPS